jgi:superfamily II DNA or RNA helicase
MIVLRPDQQKLKAEVYQGWATGSRNVLAVAPTGSGKSVVMSDIAHDIAQNKNSLVIMAHRNELVSQMSVHIASRGIKHNLIAPTDMIKFVTSRHRKKFNGRSFYNPDATIHVVGVDTLLARSESVMTKMRGVDYWFVDECHHLTRTNKWGKAVELMPFARGLGMTASPIRADGQGLGSHADGVMDAMVLGPTMRQLIDMGHLCEYQLVCPSTDFERPESVTGGGDFSHHALKEASKKSHIVGDVVDHYFSYAANKKAIVFATDVETASDMAKRFCAAGVRAAALSANTARNIRNMYTDDFETGKLEVLVNVDLFGEGFDVPTCEVVIMARPTESLGMYLQQFGRALRTSPNKQYGLVIDMVSNWLRHGLPDKQHIWSLDRRDKRAKKKPDPDDIALTVCRECSKPYERTYNVCPHCGFVPVPAGTGRSLQQVDGDLTLLTPELLAELRKSAELETPHSIMERVAYAAGEIAGKAAFNRQTERFDARDALAEQIAIWAGVQRFKGRSDSDIYRRFYLTTGVDMATALGGKRSEMEELARTVEGWIK